MPTQKQIKAAETLLKREGYTVMKKRPDLKIGDVVRFHNEDGTQDDVLITFHELGKDDCEVYIFGGVVVSEQDRKRQNTDTMWIHANEWDKDGGQYTVIGHVNLDKWIKR